MATMNGNEDDNTYIDYWDIKNVPFLYQVIVLTASLVISLVVFCKFIICQNKKYQIGILRILYFY